MKPNPHTQAARDYIVRNQDPHRRLKSRPVEADPWVARLHELGAKSVPAKTIPPTPPSSPQGKGEVDQKHSGLSIEAQAKIRTDLLDVMRTPGYSRLPSAHRSKIRAAHQALGKA